MKTWQKKSFQKIFLLTDVKYMRVKYLQLNIRQLNISNCHIDILCKKVYCRDENMTKEIFSEKLLEIRLVIIM